MVVDAVLANDEWELVLFRFRYLSPVVNKFYIAESSKTFSGLEKPLFFTEKIAELHALGYDVEVFDLDIPDSVLSSPDRWTVETYVRNTFLEKVCSRHPNDLVLFSDVDEIPSREQVVALREQGSRLQIMSIPTQVCLRKANWIEYQPEQWWGKWGNGLLGKHWVPRLRRLQHPHVEGEAGAHLSYVGMDASAVRGKYQAFSHGELDRDDLASDAFLSFTDSFHISHLGRALEPGAGLLTVAHEDELTEVQRAVQEMKPEWCDFSPVSEPRHRRLVASWLVFSIVRGKTGINLDDARAPVYSLRWLRHAVAYALVWSAWKLLSVTGLLRLLRPKTSNAPA
jgi:hypothetical protein